MALKYLALFFLFSCSVPETINLKKHQFSVTPRHIIWFQIAGLSSEHLAMLKFSLPVDRYRTSFEEQACMGNAWSFNLFKLRPNAKNGFMSQLTGSKNIKGACSDYGLTPIWDYLHEKGFHSGVLESEARASNSILPGTSCYEKNKEFFSNTIIWRMNSKANASFDGFHFQLRPNFSVGSAYYDKSCSNKGCYSNIYVNAKYLWKEYFSSKQKSFFIVRDFSYADALKKKDVVKAREALKHLDKLHAYFKRLRDSRILLLVSGSATQNFEFPKQGTDWSGFDKKGSNVLYRSTSLLSPVYATGPRSENFCGMFEEFQIFKRILWLPKKEYGLKIFN